MEGGCTHSPKFITRLSKPCSIAGVRERFSIMKQEIIKIGKNLKIDLEVKCFKEAFDIIRYEVSCTSKSFFKAYWQFSGKASNRNTYPTKSILPDVERDLNAL